MLCCVHWRTTDLLTLRSSGWRTLSRSHVSAFLIWRRCSAFTTEARCLEAASSAALSGGASSVTYTAA